MEDADSDSGIDSDGDWYHAGRDIVYGLRTNSHAVGPDGAHGRRFLCGEEKKGGTRWGCLSLLQGLSPVVTACLAPCDGGEVVRLNPCKCPIENSMRLSSSMLAPSFGWLPLHENVVYLSQRAWHRVTSPL